MKGTFSLEHLLSSTDELRCDNDIYVYILCVSVFSEEEPASQLVLPITAHVVLTGIKLVNLLYLETFCDVF